MQFNKSVSAAAATSIRQAGVEEFLVFGLDRQEYAIGIQKVQELRGYAPVTRIANAPDYIKGVINLRGVIVPIIDMRIRFGCAAPGYDASTVVIILNVAGHVVGMVVDSVADVVELTPAQIRPAPEMHVAMDASYLAGLGTLGERMLILIDIDRLMSGK